jgi:hypothetical protein
MANDVAAPLPGLDLLRGSTLTVTLDVAGATITALNVHGWLDDEAATTPARPQGQIFLIPGPATA